MNAHPIGRVRIEKWRRCIPCSWQDPQWCNAVQERLNASTNLTARLTTTTPNTPTTQDTHQKYLGLSKSVNSADGKVIVTMKMIS